MAKQDFHQLPNFWERHRLDILSLLIDFKIISITIPLPLLTSQGVYDDTAFFIKLMLSL